MSENRHFRQKIHDPVLYAAVCGVSRLVYKILSTENFLIFIFFDHALVNFGVFVVVDSNQKKIVQIILENFRIIFFFYLLDRAFSRSEELV